MIERLAILAVAAGFLLAGTAAAPLAAFETDHFLALDVELEDSAGPINVYVNGEIEIALAAVAKRRAAIACEDLPPRIYRRLFSSLFRSRVRRFLEHSPEVDRFPGPEVSNWQYFRKSIYRRPVFPFYLPLSRIVRVGDVQTGIDKFGHMFGLGRRYYRLYRRHVKRGIAPDEAVRRVVKGSVWHERFLVGGYADGVFSHADLEANYQGLVLARAMCEGPRRHLELRDGRWELVRPVDMRDYVTPYFDELFNNNRFVGPRWKRVRPIIAATYCDSYRQGKLERLWRRYRAIAKPSLSTRLVAEHLESKGRNNQAEHSLAALCGEQNRQFVLWSAL